MTVLAGRGCSVPDRDDETTEEDMATQQEQGEQIVLDLIVSKVLMEHQSERDHKARPHHRLDHREIQH